LLDIVAKPIEGAQQESVKGFGKGILKGVAGLVVKPVSGVLDLFSKTTEGIKNTMNSDDLNMQKQRKPRAFYGRHKLIKSFNAYHADVIELLNKMDEIKKRQMHFYSSEIYKNKKEEIILMVLTTKSMILIDLARKELKTEIPYSFISDLLLEESLNSIKFKFKELLYKVINEIKQKSAARIEVMSDPKVLYEKIQDARQNNTQDYYEY
jgi:vacuolar protein sorting-associated protein 13A/C